MRNSSSQDQDDILVKIDDYNNQIDAIYDGLVLIKDEKFEAESEVRELEKEVGPIKYVAQLLFGGDGEELLDKAVQVFILLLVFVFDPLAVMLVIAANQTLLRYGINLEKTGPEGDSSGDTTSGTNGDDDGPGPGNNDNSGDSQDSESGSDDADDNLSIQREGTTSDKLSEDSRPSAVDDAALAMAESAALKKELKKVKKELTKKPKEVIIEKDIKVNLKVPRSIQNLEKKLSKRLGKDDG